MQLSRPVRGIISPVGIGSYPSFPFIVGLAHVVGRGMGRTINTANNMGMEVPRARRRSKAEASPGKNVCAIVEKTKAESP